VFNDSKGWQDLGVVNVLINDTLSQGKVCYLAYVPASDWLYLVNDAGTGLADGTRVRVPTMNRKALANSQCTVEPGSVSYDADGETLSLNLRIKVSSAFSGTRTVFLAARDIHDGNNTGWQTAGTWAIP
jgi:hypothetical protein